jgi:hypothetical protein
MVVQRYSSAAVQSRRESKLHNHQARTNTVQVLQQPAHEQEAPGVAVLLHQTAVQQSTEVHQYSTG